MKMKSYRFSEETEQKILDLAIAQAVIESKQVTSTDVLRRLINNAWKKLKK